MMNWKRGSAVVVMAAVLLALAGASQAAVIDLALLLKNGSFEDAEALDGVTAGVPTDWTVFNSNSSSSAVYNPLPTEGLQAVYGSQYARVTTNATSTLSTWYKLQQADLATAVAGDTYTLTVSVGHIAGVAFSSWAGYNQVQLWVGGTKYYTDITDPGNGLWKEVTVSHTVSEAEAGQAIMVQLMAGNYKGQGARAVAFDIAPAPIPEPATMGLLVLGGVAALLRRRRN
ncbi:MAG: PEP-CTERM sorting domain-containing protein [Planctomycetaceae bacterium]|nr:PEP-CTERM sorting domain-containing protein [Planctomycetaceae bacterium]